ncbi:hypothetical protein MRX96_021598 [Rhipicephalus microplus]
MTEQRTTALDFGTWPHTHTDAHTRLNRTHERRATSQLGQPSRCAAYTQLTRGAVIPAGKQSAVEDGSPGGKASSAAGEKEASSTSSGGV